MKILVILLLGAFAIATSGQVDKAFHTPYVTWKDGEVLLWSEGGLPFPAQEFCLALRRANNGIGNPQCREAGDWQRDSATSLYAHWLASNLVPSLQAFHLRARSPLMAARLRALDDVAVLFVSKRSDTLWSVLFTGTGVEPVGLGYQPATSDAIGIADALAQAWFSEPAQRRLTVAEKQSAASAPDPFYGEKPSYDAWAGIGAGYSQARIPLTPASWYRSTRSSHIRNYRNVQDSLSAWSFLEDKSPLVSVYGGATFFGFIGLELGAHYTSHKAKPDDDTLYQELDHWNFQRFEFSLACLLTRSWDLPYSLTLEPHMSLAFLYSVLREDIALSEGYEGSYGYHNRIEFLDFYRGGSVALGSRLIWNHRLGLDLRAGFASRGRSLDREPSPDAVAEPTIIGGATFDGFLQAGLEYHWQWR